MTEHEDRPGWRASTVGADTPKGQKDKISCNSWHLILQAVSDLIEVDYPLSPTAAIREARNCSARLSLIGT